MMFKQNNNSASTLNMLGTASTSSQQSSSKQSQIQNFSKLLKKLQTENVNIEELRLLKTQHSYLQKLRNQRQKIQDLKFKFTECEQNLLRCQQDSKNQSHLLQDYETTIEMLKDELDNERERRVQLQSNYGTKVEIQREKMKTRINELMREVDELRKIVKNKDILVMQLEEQSEEKVKQMKDYFTDAKRKMVAEIEERLKAELQQKAQLESEVVELRNLVTRQNKALKQQNQKHEQLSVSNNKLVEQLEKCNDEISNLTLACEEYQEKMDHMETQNQNLIESLNELSQNAQGQGQLDELRKRMQQMAKGEIQKIQFIVNDFQ